MFSIGHLSDLHTTPVQPESARQLLNKRLTGWLSWRLRRRHLYRPAVLEALIADLDETAPDQLVVTGDLTNVGLESEFAAAREWLDRIGHPQRVFVIPGNHDAYVPISRERSWDLWGAYMAPDAAADATVPAVFDFPTLRRRGPVALIGVNSAEPSPIFMATGSVGREQRERLEEMLTRLADERVCRVVLIHHPIVEGATSARRSLVDAAEFRDVLHRAGADLVLHGHNHRTQIASVPGPHGAIPVIGVRSSSYMGEKLQKRAHYHLYDVAPSVDATSEKSFTVTLRTRAFDPNSARFVPAGEQEL
jgi:3',5'-cyclic AMP phosphodiesterase CpdA